MTASSRDAPDDATRSVFDPVDAGRIRRYRPATPRPEYTDTGALIPALKVLELRICPSLYTGWWSALRRSNMMIRLALVVFISGFSTVPRLDR